MEITHRTALSIVILLACFACGACMMLIYVYFFGGAIIAGTPSKVLVLQPQTPEEKAAIVATLNTVSDATSTTIASTTQHHSFASMRTGTTTVSTAQADTADTYAPQKLNIIHSLKAQ